MAKNAEGISSGGILSLEKGIETLETILSDILLI